MSELIIVPTLVPVVLPFNKLKTIKKLTEIIFSLYLALLTLSQNYFFRSFASQVFYQPQEV